MKAVSVPSQSCQNGVVIKPEGVSPYFKWLGFTFVGKHQRRSSIPDLIPVCGPPAIFRSISLFIVDSLQSVTRGLRATSHVLKEVFKIHPPFTYRNSSPSIVLVGAAGFTVAPSSHCRPRLPFWRIAQPMGGCVILCDAPATLGASSPASHKLPTIDYLFSAALTNASPVGVVLDMRHGVNREFPKNPTSQIVDSVWHTGDRKTIHHNVK